MMRAIAKWLISRSLDRNIPLPRWVRKKIDSEPELKQFESLARLLADRLKDDAPIWAATQTAMETCDSGQRHSVPIHRLGVPRRMSWSLAAGALVVGLVFFVVVNRSAIDDSNQPAIQSQWLTAAWRTGQRNFNELKARSDSLSSCIVSPRFPRLFRIVEPPELQGAISGGVAATLDGVDVQGKQWMSDLKCAFSFFTHRLPITAVKVLGLSNHDSA